MRLDEFNDENILSNEEGIKKLIQIRIKLLKDNMTYDPKLFILDRNTTGIINANFYKKYDIKDSNEKPYLINKM